MTATSQNGLSVPLTAAEQVALIQSYSLLGGVVRLRKGPVATILTYIATYLDAHVEKVDTTPWQMWGFNVRPIRGQTKGYSNHASGSALDYNATRHGRNSTSRYSGYNSTQVSEIHALLKYLDGVVRWGGDYVSKPYDPMHFEINTSDSKRIAALAVKLEAINMSTDVPHDVWAYQQQGAGPQAWGYLKSIYANSTKMVQMLSDTTGLAAEIAKNLPPSQVVTQEMLNEAIRTVMGSVDNIPPTGS